MKESILYLCERTKITSKQWMCSILLRINDDKLIDEVFTRIFVFNADDSDINIIYDRLFALYKEKNFSPYWSIVKFEIIIDFIARLTLKLSENKIIEFLKDFITFALNVDNEKHFFICEAINKAFYKMKYHMSKKILLEIKSELLRVPTNKTDPMTLNDYLGYEAFTDIKDEYLEILDGVKSQDENIRRSALLRLLRITDYISANNKDNEICTVLWGESDNLPQAKDLRLVAWETLPHPQHIDFQNIYKKYLLKHPSFNFANNMKGVRFGSGISKSSDIREFLHFFVITSHSFNTLDFSHVVWNPNELVTLINQVKTYVENEKDYINDRDDWDFDINLPYNIALATYYIASEALSLDVTSDDFWLAYEDVKQVLNEIEFNTLHLNFIHELKNNTELTSDIKCSIEQNIYSSDYKLVLTSFETIISIESSREKDSIDFEWSINVLKSMFLRMPYLDSRCLSISLGQINRILVRIIFENCLQESLEFIESSLGILKRNFDIKKHDEYLLEVAVNLARFVRYIYKQYNNVELPSQIVNAIKYFRKSELPETRNIWYDCDVVAE